MDASVAAAPPSPRVAKRLFGATASPPVATATDDIGEDAHKAAASWFSSRTFEGWSSSNPLEISKALSDMTSQARLGIVSLARSLDRISNAVDRLRGEHHGLSGEVKSLSSTMVRFDGAVKAEIQRQTDQMDSTIEDAKILTADLERIKKIVEAAMGKVDTVVTQHDINQDVLKARIEQILEVHPAVVSAIGSLHSRRLDGDKSLKEVIEGISGRLSHLEANVYTQARDTKGGMTSQNSKDTWRSLSPSAKNSEFPVGAGNRS